MFEINLVPDVKGELLKKQRQRNLIIFISIVVAIASAAVVVLLGSIVTGQNIRLSSQDREMDCRSKGTTDGRGCSGYGVAIMRTPSLNEYLTIQDQMGKISDINRDKLLLSRVFGVLDVILPTGDDRIEISELTVNLTEATLNFDAQGWSVSNINYRALEVFKNIITLSYYDHGRYMRYDREVNDFVEIPTTCIDETREPGYGIYLKGTPGCETSVLSGSQQEDEEGNVTEEVPVEDIRIKRAYSTLDEKEEYIGTANESDGVFYYFESECVVYGDEGRFDEVETRAMCRLSEIAPLIRSSSNARDADGNLVLRFSATVVLNKEVFRFVNKHMKVIGPTRQNVTDSYTQIRGMFVETPRDCSPDDTQCLQEAPNGG